MKTKLKVKNYDLKNSTSKKAYNEKLFDIVAPKYDFVTRILSFGRDSAWKKKLMKMLPDNAGELSVLDLACGTGDVTFLLSKKYPEGQVIGFDLNRVMLELASKRFAGNTALSFEAGNMADTKKPDGAFDIVTGSYALRNAPDIRSTLQEIYRITKPGGTCGFLDFSKSSNTFIQHTQHFFLKLWGSIWGILLHGNHEIYAYIADSLKLFPERQQLTAMIQEIGFKNIRSKILFFGFIEIIIFEK